MIVALLDVNVLVALFHSGHPQNDAAHRWFEQNRKYGWASCPITINGCIRILSGPSYPVQRQPPADLARRLRNFCDTIDHHFWPDSVSLLDETLFQITAVAGYQNITDAYLLGLAVRNHGRLATFDRGIPLDAVKEARPSNLVVIRSA